VKDRRPAYYAYAQTYTQSGRTFNRRGFFALVKLSPFGQGEVVPHEKTYPDAIADRLKLMRATATQLSPIFGLFSDPENRVTSRLFAGLEQPDMSATLDGVKNELWIVTDSHALADVTQLMAAKPVYIADGHHRYTMALQYEKEHPAADHALFVLVAMQDPGLVILPTHRIIGGLGEFNIDALRRKLGDNADLTEQPGGAGAVAGYGGQTLPTRPGGTFGLYDGTARKLYELRIKNPDVLKPLEPTQSQAWRSLDVAILQRYLLDEIIAPGGRCTKAYTASAADVVPMTDGVTRQIALLPRPTPLGALVELGKHNEVMPQKSTYFFPKLATGLVLHPLNQDAPL
jgi:uncharacterized protein (DUF1015 family)